MKLNQKKKVTSKEVANAWKILKLKKEQSLDDYFKCQCPQEIKVLGGLHRCPIDCATEPKDIVKVCDYYIKYFNKHTKSLKKLRAKNNK